jgi:hypothetical protein
MLDPREPAGKRNPIEEFLRHLPGFRGYFELEDRRESDALTRKWLADQLDGAKRALNALSQSLVDQGQLDALPQIDRLRGRLDKLIARIRGAMRGYSGFFDRVQIDADTLERVYFYDLDLMQNVDAWVQAAGQLPASQAQWTDALADLRNRLEQLDRQWDGRDELFRNMKE